MHSIMINEVPSEISEVVNPNEEMLLMLKAYAVLDVLERWFVTYGLIFCQIGVLAVAFIPPANTLSLVFIFYFQVFLYLNYTLGDL